MEGYDAAQGSEETALTLERFRLARPDSRASAVPT
jgi:hypothetical protein